MIKKLINLNSHVSVSVASAAFLITVAGLASRFLGLFRDRLLAAHFGAGDALDVYYAAFRIPDLIYNILILGALSSAFIPVFASLISNDSKKEAWNLANGIINLILALIVILSFVCCIFTPTLMKLITPGFDGEKMEQVISLTRIMFLSPLFLGLSGIFGSILTSFRRFFIYSLAPIFYNAGIIFGIFFFVNRWGIIGLAWGVVLGAILHMISQYIAVKTLGFKYKCSFLPHFSNIEIKKVFQLMIPRTLGIAANQINLFVITIFASFLASGSLAIFSFAQNLQGVPLGIFGVSFAIAAFPTLSAMATKKNKDDFIRVFSETFRQILFFVIPISAFMLILRAQIVRIVLGTGKFDWEDTTLTFQCLGFFTLSLFAQSVVPLLARTFYALQNTKIPFYIALVSEAINILIVVLLIEKYQILSLVIAFSFSAIVQMLLLLFVLRFKLDNLDDRRIISSLAKISLATILGGITVQIFKYISINFVNLDTFLGVFFQLAISSIAGLLVFALVAHLIKLEEFHNFRASITRRIFKKPVLSESTGEVSGV